MAFMRPQAVELGPDGKVYVADCANHRVQVFTTEGELLRGFGTPGIATGRMSYPFDLKFDARGRMVLLESTAHRISIWDPASGTWKAERGSLGNGPGQLANPRGMCLLPDGTALIADSDNHRIQRWRLPD